MSLFGPSRRERAAEDAACAARLTRFADEESAEAEKYSKEIKSLRKRERVGLYKDPEATRQLVRRAEDDRLACRKNAREARKNAARLTTRRWF
ncbi:hypothetical protein ATK36_0468 [Amycolatopsis sulphurea]|uniref:Uncharacterized protein n=1 Tax=Amycolatopsis sulphurea TaxID=76022 RepID=A0A2A9G242_9PSEU|nr:hypothetical protein [Amycolatopsis sulphurea]PFG56932.1 hypothetical protein ATK36_0468 [Amycolatopsis sulphurea]